MANKLLIMQQIRMILQLLGRKLSERRIAGELQLSRNTVKQYRERLQASGQSYEQLQALSDEALDRLVYATSQQRKPDVRRSDFEQRTKYFVAELGRTGVTLQLLWEEYRKECPDGYEYSRFCELFSHHRLLEQATMHFSYKPAEMMMVDFAGDMLSYLDRETGAEVKCVVFVAVLPYSGYSYAIALRDGSQPSVIEALNACLSWFEGVPYCLKCDNMKTAVTKSCRYEPVFTDTLQQWALHNSIALTAARVRKPKDKAPVESEVNFIYQRVYARLRNETFYSLNGLNNRITNLLNEYMCRPFQKKESCRRDRFLSEEKPLLQPLPAMPYELKHRVTAKVQKNYHILLGENTTYYSVPYQYIGKNVIAVYDSATVEIYDQHTRIAIHKRIHKAHTYSTEKQHMPEKHQHYAEQQGWDPQYFRTWAKNTGPFTAQYIGHMLDARHFTEQTYKGCLGVLRLKTAYGTARLEAACCRALQGGKYNYGIVNNILQNNLDKQPVQPGLFDIPQHENIRGAEAYQ